MHASKIELAGCIYCGSAVDITKDHVPPKCLFEPPLPSNLITVPCCGSCNKKFGRDDEYLKTAFVLRWDVDDHGVAVARRASAFRALSRPGARGFADLFTETLENAPIILNSGLYVEEGCRFDVDIDRIRRVVVRIVRALHCIKTGEILPYDQDILVLEDEILEQAGPELREEILRGIAPMLQGEPERLGDDVFLFFWRARGKFSSEWFIVFYSKIIYFAATAPASPGAI